jgi:hypothetical protein
MLQGYARSVFDGLTFEVIQQLRQQIADNHLTEDDASDLLMKAVAEQDRGRRQTFGLNHVQHALALGAVLEVDAARAQQAAQPVGQADHDAV